MKCKKCGKEFSPCKGLKNYCSLECRNSRQFSEETKKRKRDKALVYWENNPFEKVERKSICVVCGDEFDYKWNVKTCSKTCNNYLLSLRRQEIISLKGTNNFNTKQELFSYKFVKNIETDSKLEQAAIIYLIDILKVDKIEIYKNILNFWEKDSHRTFNPDFYVKKDDKVYIVEVKMKWSVASKHDYNRTIPLKKEALQKYCKKKGYKMIWLDFDYDEKFQKIYYQLLKEKKMAS